jgi:hypothetical protein
MAREEPGMRMRITAIQELKWYQKGPSHASETHQGSCESDGQAGHQSGHLNRGSVGVCLCDGIRVSTVPVGFQDGY